jgi:hypothetical protein
MNGTLQRTHFRTPFRFSHLQESATGADRGRVGHERIELFASTANSSVR